MTYSSLATEAYSTSQQSSRGYAIDHIILHHCASTNMDGVIGMMTSGSREVSANYVVKDARIASVVPEEKRSWSVSSSLWDGRSITFEICNESVGGDWPVSAASHESVAKLVADICRRYGIPCNRDRIFGHRELLPRHGAGYATACPGGLNLDWIVTRAAQILNPQKAETKVNDLEYIYTDEGGVEYAVIAPAYLNNGHARTKDKAEAEAYSLISPTGAPRKCTRVQFENTIKLGTRLWTERLASFGPGSVEIGDVEIGSAVTLAPATITALAQAIAKAHLDAEAARLKD